MAPGKELHYFDRNLDRGEQWYRECFAGATAGQRVGEATPNYLFDARAIERMAELVPSADLIVSVREPVARAYSHYWMERERGRELRSFADAVRGELAGDQQSTYVARGHYAEQLERAERSYPRGQLHVLLFDDLVADPQRMYGELVGVLGLPPRAEPSGLSTPVNSYVRFRSLRVDRTMLGWQRRFPTNPAVRSATRGVRRLNTRRDTAYPPADADVAHRLLEHFASHNARLASWLGRPLPEAWAVAEAG
jgi:hypothetical protein